MPKAELWTFLVAHLGPFLVEAPKGEPFISTPLGKLKKRIRFRVRTRRGELRLDSKWFRSTSGIRRIPWWQGTLPRFWCPDNQAAVPSGEFSSWQCNLDPLPQDVIRKAPVANSSFGERGRIQSLSDNPFG